MSQSRSSDYWVWADYLHGSEWAEAWGQDGMAGEYVKVLRGEPLEKPWPTVRITKLTPGELPDLLTAPIHPIISQRLKEILEGTGANLQAIPVKLERKRKQYYLLNLLEHLRCLDEARSKVKRNESGMVTKVSKLAIGPVPKDAPPIFRVAGVPWAIVVRDDLRRTLEQRCAGPGRFLRIEEYKFG